MFDWDAEPRIASAGRWALWMTERASSALSGRLSVMDEAADATGSETPRKALVGLAMENPCPVCGSESVIPILYGLHTAALKPLSEARQVEIAGCCWDEAKPSSRCRDCGHAWARGPG